MSDAGKILMQPSILDEAISPAAAVEALARRGVHVSERALREKARQLGAYREIGKAFFFLPADLERIIAPEPADLERIAAPRRSAARSAASDLNEARAKLQSLKAPKRSGA